MPHTILYVRALTTIARFLLGAEPHTAAFRMLRIVETDLLLALGDNDPNNVSYLDRETGDVILVPGDLFSPEDEEYVDEEALAADPRYVPVEPISSDEAYRWMEHFASLVAAPELRDRLARALNRPRRFRGFKDALLDFPTERQQ